METKEMRKELKSKLGYNAKQVSVSSKNGNFKFTIRDLNVDIKAVENFANKFEKIHRCEHSGEILSGGNTYVDVIYSNDIINFAENIYLNEVKSATSEIIENFLIPVGNLGFFVGGDDNHLTLWSDRYEINTLTFYGNNEYILKEISFKIWKIIKTHPVKKYAPQEDGFDGESKGR